MFGMLKYIIARFWEEKQIGVEIGVIGKIGQIYHMTTLHWSLRVLGPWYTNYMIGREVGDGPHTLYTRPWGPSWPKEFEWMENINSIVHGTKWILLHGLLDIVLGPSKTDGPNAKWVQN